MHVAERNRELERQRKQRQIRTEPRTRPEPAHRRYALRVSRLGRTIPPPRLKNSSNNVTLRQLGRIAIHLACCKKSTLQRCQHIDGRRWRSSNQRLALIQVSNSSSGWWLPQTRCGRAARSRREYSSRVYFEGDLVD